MLVLGKGYVGSALLNRFPNARFTNRKIFELKDRATWKNDVLSVKEGEEVVWTFPAAQSLEEADLALELYETYFKKAKTIIFGSTNSYQTQNRGELVTEDTPLKLEDLRTQTEEKLRVRGACIVHLAGIFGPGRDPLDWYLKKRIHSGRSYLNLIHLDDIVNWTTKILGSKDLSCRRLNLSNGYFKTHLEIVQNLKKLQLLPENYYLPAIDQDGSKKVSNHGVRQFLSTFNYSFIDFPGKTR